MSKNKHKHNRRLFLQGFGGLAIGLPLLEFTERTAFGQTAKPVAKRLVTFFEHGGTLSNCSAGVYGYSGFSDGTSDAQAMDGWRPVSAPGAALQLGAIHKPLADAGLTQDVNVLRGINNPASDAQGQYGSNHGIANVTILTCAKAQSPDGSDEKRSPLSPSIDQVIAQRLGAPSGGMASLNAMIMAHNYGTPYYRAANQEASIYFDPKKAFDAILTGVQTSGTPTPTGPDPAIVRAQMMKKSVLDGTSKGLAQYRNKLSTQDKQVIDAHLEHIRSIETRLAAQVAPPAAPPASCSKPTLTNYGGTLDWTVDQAKIPTTYPLFVDIGLAAMRCGRTNVFNLECGDFHMTWDAQTRSLPLDVGYDLGHSLHHMARDLGQTGPITKQHPDWVSMWQTEMIRNRQYRSQIVARLLKGLKDTPEPGGGNMLDSSFFFWTSEFSNGSWHLAKDMPFLIAGKASGQIQTGRYIDYNTKTGLAYDSTTSNHNLFISVLNLFGQPDTTFGDMSYAKKTGPLVGL